MARVLNIGLLSSATAEDTAVVSALTDLINEVYAVAEDGLWTDGSTRTTAEEVADLTRAGEIAVAVLGERIVGCIRIRQLGDDVSEFGMLAAAPSHRGIGVGRELVRFAEQSSRDDGHGTMQLELLVPREWKHPSKEFLARWYDRMGYKMVRTGSADEFYPNLSPLLATPCDFVIYRKDIRCMS
jgi:GNAT superfamily N-acetyltransferase